MIVLVHGVPETAALWDKVRVELRQDSVALSLPGFGCARPEGFGATKDEYASWLTSQLEAFDEPVDLVGHDWGALLAYRVISTRSDLLRSWVADVGNGAHSHARWHAFAQTWQTPGEGEAYFEQLLSTPAARTAQALEGFHLNPEDALAVARYCDATMATCILDLYRSAMPNIHADWGHRFGPTPVPGLIVHASLDVFGDEAMSRAVATSFGAHHETLHGVGHWWALEDPRQAASMIEGFIRSVN